jgi:catechol 2,3-dioxygenase-like lactoylglutathione lyase family enzyme
MQQQISIITLGVGDIGRSKRFYRDGFGWAPVFENGEIVFYQAAPGAFSLAHNVAAAAEVDQVLEKLAAAGGRILRPGEAPAHGGFRGYAADPDEHAWEIAWNPAWPIDAQGHVTFGL